MTFYDCSLYFHARLQANAFHAYSARTHLVILQNICDSPVLRIAKSSEERQSDVERSRPELTDTGTDDTSEHTTQHQTRRHDNNRQSVTTLHTHIAPVRLSLSASVSVPAGARQFSI